MTCSFEECLREVHAKKLCKAHYNQQWKGNSLKPLKEFFPLPHCRFPGCDKMKIGKGYCNGHWQQQYHGRPLSPLKKRTRYKDKNCGFPGCEKERSRHGAYCSGHLDQKYRGKALTPINRDKDRKCEFPGCGKKHQSKGLCVGHRGQQKRGKPLSPLRSREAHGYSVANSSTYRSWAAMKQRCYGKGKQRREYKDYKDRGIIICDRWRFSFLNFLEDMGERPEWATGGIDRIDPNGNYELKNCRWADSKTQQSNRRPI